MKSFSVVTFVLSALLISWNRNTPTIDKIPYDNEIESHLIKKEGVLVGLSGNYKFAINQNLSILKIYFDGNQYVLYSKTPPDSKNSFELTNEFLVFRIWLDDNGSPLTKIERPSHNNQIATTAVITLVGKQNQSTSFLPPIDFQMANYDGTIESKLSVDDGKSFGNDFKSAICNITLNNCEIYNITLVNCEIRGLLKYNTFSRESIHTIVGTIISNSHTHKSLKINSISNRITDTLTFSKPVVEI